MTLTKRHILISKICRRTIVVCSLMVWSVASATGHTFDIETMISDNPPVDRGFVVDGTQFMRFGNPRTSRIGDINNDGVDDFVYMYEASDYPFTEGGLAYVIFGQHDSADFPQHWSLDLLSTMHEGENRGVALLGPGLGFRLGTAVSDVGDMNGDGIDDFTIGAPAELTGLGGDVYIVFGRAKGDPFPEELRFFDLLQGATWGKVLRGQELFAETGNALAGIGDVNDDGVNDLIIRSDDLTGGGPRITGRLYVFFGGSHVNEPGIFLLDDLATGISDHGFVFQGEDVGTFWLNLMFAHGDFNGDGISDFTILPDPDFTLASPTLAVIYGGQHLNDLQSVSATEVLDLALPSLLITGETGNFLDTAFFSQTFVDMDNDSVEDLVTCWSGSFQEDQCAVIYGDRTLPDRLSRNILDIMPRGGVNADWGFKIEGVDSFLGNTGDLNGDGLHEIVFGAPATVVGNAGDVQNMLFQDMVFLVSTRNHRSEWPKVLDLKRNWPDSPLPLNGVFTIYAGTIFQGFGSMIEGVGLDADVIDDINGDGYGDILLSAPGALHHEFLPRRAGRAYVVYGGPFIPAFRGPIPVPGLSTGFLMLLGLMLLGFASRKLGRD